MTGCGQSTAGKVVGTLLPDSLGIEWIVELIAAARGPTHYLLRFDSPIPMLSHLENPGLRRRGVSVRIVDGVAIVVRHVRAALQAYRSDAIRSTFSHVDTEKTSVFGESTTHLVIMPEDAPNQISDVVRTLPRIVGPLFNHLSDEAVGGSLLPRHPR